MSQDRRGAEGTYLLTQSSTSTITNAVEDVKTADPSRVRYVQVSEALYAADDRDRW